MRRLLHAVFIGSLWVAAGSAAETVELVNGDRISGEVIKVEPDTVVFRSKLFGEIKLPRESIQSDLAALNAGPPAPLDEKGEPVVAPAPAAVGEKPVPSLRELLHIPDALTGKIKASAYRRRQGHLEDYVEIAPSFTWTDPHKVHSLKWAFNYRYRRDNDSDEGAWEIEDDRFTAEQKYRYNLDTSMFAQSRTYWEKDRVDLVDPRLIQSVSLGVYVLNGDSLKLDFAPGVGYEYLKDDGEVSEEFAPTFEQSFTWKINSRFEYEESFSFVGDDSEYQYDFTNELEAKLNGSLSIVLRHSLEYDKEVDDDGTEENSRDERTTASVQLSF